MPSEAEYSYHDLKPDSEDMASEVLSGLRSTPKYISPKYFYDARGSALFERITRLPEYYLTRTEMALFDAHLEDMAALLPKDLCIVEYGSGSSMKIRKLLESLTPRAYVPVDISAEHLEQNARTLHADFPGIAVYPVCADFSQPFTLPDTVVHHSKLAFFPGSSIGNFEPEQARDLLANVRQTVGETGAMLIGVDRKKATAILERAYDDAAGVTAQFNLNALAHLNESLGADFDLSAFEHVARYNAEAGCIQMFLRSCREQRVKVAGETISLAANEEIHTENSFKYHPDEFLELARSVGFAEVSRWSDSQDWFTLYLLA
jgi:dimethylhistidine N-methyltransferase